MLKIVETDKKSIDKVCMDLEEAVKRHRFGVLTIHNLKETLIQKGIAFDSECRIYEVCNPQQAKNVLEKDLSLSTALPCRISVYEEGGKIKLATMRPTVLMGEFQRGELWEVAKEVEKLLIEMMEEAARKVQQP